MNFEYENVRYELHAICFDYDIIFKSTHYYCLYVSIDGRMSLLHSVMIDLAVGCGFPVLKLLEMCCFRIQWVFHAHQTESRYNYCLHDGIEADFICAFNPCI